MNRVAFVIGHNSKDKGAYSKILDYSEWDMWNCFYDSYLTELGDNFNHNLSSSYTQRQKSMAKLTKDYDLVFELHYNASSPSANGVEALVYYSNNKMRALGELYCKLMSESMGLKNRGCKRVTSGNGFGFLEKTKGSAIILEPFFGSNYNDCENYKDRKHAKVIEQVILSYFN